jgi:hypothetical protein
MISPAMMNPYIEGNRVGPWSSVKVSAEADMSSAPYDWLRGHNGFHQR